MRAHGIKVPYDQVGRLEQGEKPQKANLYLSDSFTQIDFFGPSLPRVPSAMSVVSNAWSGGFLAIGTI